MKYLIPGGVKLERLTLLLSLTSIKSDDIKSAIADRLVRGASESDAAALNDVSQSNLSRAMVRVNLVAEKVEKIKEIDWAKFKSLN